MGFFSKLFKRNKQPVITLTAEQQAAMSYYFEHTWPTPLAELAAGEQVWVLDKGRTAHLGTVDGLRRVDVGQPYWVIRYGDKSSECVTVKQGGPVFGNKSDLLRWHIGDRWKEISRLYHNLQRAEVSVDAVIHYTNNRVSNLMMEIRFLKSQED